MNLNESNVIFQKKCTIFCGNKSNGLSETMILFLGKKELISASMSQLDVHKMLVLSEYTTSSL